MEIISVFDAKTIVNFKRALDVMLGKVLCGVFVLVLG
jgi:hypothetical protein